MKTFLFKIPKFFSFSHSVCIEHFKILCKTIFHLLKKHTYKKKMIISEFQDIFQNLGQVLDLYSCLHSTSKTKSQLKLIQVDFHVYQTKNCVISRKMTKNLVFRVLVTFFCQIEAVIPRYSTRYLDMFLLMTKTQS